MWVDALLMPVWKYLFENPHLEIPESWQRAMMDFDKRLTEKETCMVYDVLVSLPDLMGQFPHGSNRLKMNRCSSVAKERLLILNLVAPCWCFPLKQALQPR